MSEFKRGINQSFVDRLNAEYSTGGWWKSIADDRELFVAIRNGYLNVYWNGNSLLRLWQEGNQLVGEIHYKYLLAPEYSRPYIKVTDGKAVIDEAAAFFKGDLSDLKALKRAANVYSGEEKKGVHQIVMRNQNVIDVEIAFGAENELRGSRTANRIDFAALRQGQAGLEVVFYEAKQFANEDLRAATGSARALEQLSRYEKFLCNAQASLIESYRTICGNLSSLCGVNTRYSSILAATGNTEQLAINTGVRLIIFGFDADQKNGKNWEPHFARLRNNLQDRLLMKGDANNFTNGIS